MYFSDTSSSPSSSWLIRNYKIQDKLLSIIRNYESHQLRDGKLSYPPCCCVSTFTGRGERWTAKNSTQKIPRRANIFIRMLTSIPRPQPLTWMKPSQHNSQLSQFNYLMDTGHSWWNVLIRWFSLMMIVRKMIASHTNWNISAFLLFARNLALTRIMDWRRRWDIYCLYIVVLTLHCCRQRIPALSTSSHEECDW